MHDFLRRYRVVLSSGFFLLLSLLLATVNTRGSFRVDPVGVLLLEVMHPLQIGVTLLSRETERLWTRYVALWSVQQQNEELRRRLQVAEDEAGQAVELNLANQRLERLLALQSELGLHGVAARVVGRSPVAWVHTLILDKGQGDGVTRGMAVLSSDGVVGQVVSVSRHAARVLLLSDPNSGADVLVQRTRVRGIVAGSLAAHCLLKYIQRGEDIKAGDVVVTSGLDGIFPKGQTVGRIAWIGAQDSRMFQDVEVKLSAELDKVEEVLVVAPGVVRAGG